MPQILEATSRSPTRSTRQTAFWAGSWNSPSLHIYQKPPKQAPSAAVALHAKITRVHHKAEETSTRDGFGKARGAPAVPDISLYTKATYHGNQRKATSAGIIITSTSNYRNMNAAYVFPN